MICSIENCGKPARTAGLCNAHYLRKWRHGSPLAGATGRGEHKKWIEAHYDYSGDDCLLWPFARTSAGYGKTTWGPQEEYVHRIMCKHKHGDPPNAKSVTRHLCGNGHLGCCNPHHLLWGSQYQNARDAIAHGRVRSGEQHPNTKLTWNDVDEIRRLHATKAYTHAELKRMFNVGAAAIHFIVNNKTWVKRYFSGENSPRRISS